MPRDEVCIAKRPWLRCIMAIALFVLFTGALYSSPPPVVDRVEKWTLDYINSTTGLDISTFLQGDHPGHRVAPILLAAIGTAIVYRLVIVRGARWIEKRWPRSDRPPYRFVANTVGRIRFTIAAKDRRNLREAFRLSYPILFPDFKLIPLGQEPPSAELVASKFYTIITGPPGVGKTTYLVGLVNPIRDEFDLLVDIAPAELAEAVEANDHSLLWLIIRNSISAVGATQLPENEKETALHPAALAFILNRRKLLIILNDLHTAGRPASEVFSFIAGYFSVYHRWAPHVSIVCATRERQETLAANTVHFANIIGLQPLGQGRSQDVFYAGSKEVGLEDVELLRHYDKLAAAFATPALQVPLFIFLSAWLVSPRRGRQQVPVGRVLNMTATELLHAYLETLYIRAVRKSGSENGDQHALGSEDFRRALDALAYEFWPKWERLQAKEVAERIGRLSVGQPQHLTHLDLQFMANNGFLFQNRVNGSVGFAHEAVADYLASAEMVRLNDYARLSLYRNPVRLDGIAAMLAQLIETNEAFEQLIYDKLDVALRLLREPGFQIPGGLDFDVVGRNGARWASSGAPHAITPAEWREFGALLMRDDSGIGLDSLLSWVRRAGPSFEGVTALLSVGISEARELVEEWASLPHVEEAFNRAARLVEVEGGLLEIVRTAGLTSTPGHNVFATLWRSRDKGERETNSPRPMNIWLHSLIKTGRRNELGTLMKTHKKPMISYLARIAERESYRSRKMLSETCAERLAQALIAPGRYEITDEKVRREVVITAPVLVPCLAKELGEFSRKGEAQAAAAKVSEKLMYIDEARVVARYFQHDLQSGRKGVMFQREPNTYEAFRETVARVEFFGFYRNTSRAVVALTDSGEKPMRFKAVYRSVERLSPNSPG